MAEAAAPKRRYTRLTPERWAEARAAWATGGVTAEDLAARFGCSVRAVQLHMAEHKVAKGSAAAALAAAVEAKVLAEALPSEDDLAHRIRDTREGTYADAVAIQRLVMGNVALAQDPRTAMGAVAALRALDLAAAAVGRTQRIRWLALGIDKALPAAGELPELPIRALTDEEVEAIRAQQLAEDAAASGAEDGHADADDVVIEGEDDNSSPSSVRGDSPERISLSVADNTGTDPDAGVERVGGDESRPRVIGRG